MLRNCLAVIGAIALVGIFKSQILAKVPALNILPLPSVTVQWGNTNNSSQPGSDRPANNSQNNPNNSVSPQTSPSPSPSPQAKRWGIHFEMKSNIGDQSGK